MQGFDKYGVGAHTAVPTSHLQKALKFKVTASALHMALVLLAQSSCSHCHRCTLQGSNIACYLHLPVLIPLILAEKCLLWWVPVQVDCSVFLPAS